MPKDDDETTALKAELSNIAAQIREHQEKARLEKHIFFLKGTSDVICRLTCPLHNGTFYTFILSTMMKIFLFSYVKKDNCGFSLKITLGLMHHRNIKDFTRCLSFC